MDSMPCECRRIVRLDLPGGAPIWICNVCNKQFMEMRAAAYRIEHLAGTLMTLIEEEVIDIEQVKRVWGEEGIQIP